MLGFYKLSLYTIFVKLKQADDQYLLIHGYTGAIDIVNGSIVRHLKSHRNHLVPQEWPFTANTFQLLLKRGYITDRNQNEEIINANKILSITSYVSFSIWLLLFVLFFELFFPLVVFKRGRLTLGRKVFSIGLIDVNALNIKASKYLGRVAFIVIVMYVIGFFSFLLPLFVSLGMMFISKRHQDLVDYVFNTYVVDIKKDEIYLDQLDFLDKTNKDKKVKLEDKDLTITNWF